MTWFGFGFNAFGQINPADAPAGDSDCPQVKVAFPTEVNVPFRESEGERGEHDGVRLKASWSRVVTFSVKGDRQVCLSGFGVAGGHVPDSQGCVDAQIGERYVTLRFSDRVECWSCTDAQTTLACQRQQDPSGLSVSLPLVSEGYVASKPPLFRSLAPHLRAVSLALGTEHALLLTADGTIYTWGRGSHGQLGHGLLSPEEEPRALEALWGVPMSSVAAGGWHSACISAGGDLYVWGWNESGQLGLPSRGLKKDLTRAATDTTLPGGEDGKSSHGVFISIQAFPALLDIPQVSEICKVSCGSRHTAAVTGTGDLYTWGWGEYGQLGQGGTCSSDQAERVDFFSSRGLHVEDVTCGQWNTFAFARPEPSCCSGSSQWKPDCSVCK